MRHTKGPWEIAEEGGSLFIVNKNDDIGVCKILNDSAPALQESCRADAALIAAAPEMLAVLESLADYNFNDGDQRLKKIERVLKKAKGELK